MMSFHPASKFSRAKSLLPAGKVQYVTVAPGEKIAFATVGTVPLTVSVVEITQ